MSRRMKDSGVAWIGEIQADWIDSRLKSVFIGRCGGAWGVEHQTDENDRVCIRVADFDFESQTVSDNEKTVRNYTKDQIERLNLVNGDILIEKSGGGEKTPVGRSIIFDIDEVCVFSNFIERLRPKNTVNSRYIAYLLKTVYQSTYMSIYIKQTTGIQNLDISSMLYERIYLPSIEIQNAIIVYLELKTTKIDRLIALQEEMIAELQAYKQSVITEAVTKGLDPDAPMKDSGVEWFGSIPKGWNCAALKVVVSCNDNSLSGNEDSTLIIKYIDISSVNALGEIKNIEEIVFQNAPSRARRIAHTGDIILSTVRTYLKAIALVSEKQKNYVFSTGFAVLRPEEDKIRNKFLFFILYSDAFTYSVQAFSDGIAYPAISSNKLINLKITIPPIKEQDSIIEYLNYQSSKIDNLISVKKSKIETLKEYKKSLIYECVTGKRDCTAGGQKNGA